MMSVEELFKIIEDYDATVLFLIYYKLRGWNFDAC
jgi:hypothetical protein